ncbi:MAG: transcription-repair coupling factor [Acidobacteria bacterium]|nr:transcription-repair coupling factor [Acidobacteriota bacterium]
MILPSVAELLGRIRRHPAVEATLDSLQRGGRETRLAGLTDPAKALIVAQVAAALHRPVLFLVESNQRAETLAEPVRFFYRALSGKPATQVATLPALDVLPWQNLSPHPEILETRAVALWRFASGQAPLVVVPIAAARLRLREAEFYRGLARTLARDGDVSLDDLVAHLTSVGYERHETVEMPGQFAVRGGIVDVFSPESPRPVRLELFGDTLDSLREFDPSTQRSVGPLERVTLPPLTEFPRRSDLVERIYALAAVRAGAPAGEETRYADAFPGWEFEAARLEPGTASLFELSDPPIVILDEPQTLERVAEEFRERLAEACARTRERSDFGSQAVGPEVYYFSEDEWQRALEPRERLLLEHLPLHREGPAPRVNYEPCVLVTQPTTRYHGNVAAFLAEVRGRIVAGEQVMVAAASTGELERLADLCHEYEMPYRLGELEENVTTVRLAEDSSAGSVPAMVLCKAPLSEGVVFPECKLALYGTSDLFETLAAPARPKRRPKTASFFSDFSEVKPGDFVVHVDHGIGQFEGLRQLEEESARGEFMLLRYAEDARLYVPLERMDLVQSYRSLEGARPQLDNLGGTAWVARKTRVRKTLSDLADQLLRLYAERKTSPGFAFAPDVPWQKEFEDAFEFEETPDQAAAIADVKRDMERPLPMDRLLCGDVGYGKTEVAMRAAFKAVADSKQVAVLAPTTVLVFQHFETFRQRFAAFPVRVEMLSRFRSSREQKGVLAAIEAGTVDIVIGTHRLLSRDVRFHDLGLLVVDEEQRFGVAHKERLKELSKNVDVLTLSATPIPRTLNMSLVGLRDMSVIETPPKDRLAIQTVVASFQESLIQRAIEQELARQGQVFFVHNRVESIHSMASLVHKLVPRARVVVGHGQMSEKELERVMLKFVRDLADVLVSTTIVENGLDIPRANTIIVNRADRFGLSELYQLRGRVGRSNQRAYAYLLVPPEASLPPLARRRLAALREFSELGAGFRIAALDLELRGAGHLLGRQQHGHINAIGFDLYCQMLERAVAGLKGEAPAPELRATLNLGLDIRIPPEYIPSENLRLRTYKRIAGISSEAEREEVRREFEDRFGPAPPAIGNLLDYAVLKALCERLLVASVERHGEQVAIKFHPQTPVRGEQVVHVIRTRRGLRLDPSGVLWTEVRREQGSLTQAVRNVLLQLQP